MLPALPARCTSGRLASVTLASIVDVVARSTVWVQGSAMVADHHDHLRLWCWPVPAVVKRLLSAMRAMVVRGTIGASRPVTGVLQALVQAMAHALMQAQVQAMAWANVTGTSIVYDVAVAMSLGGRAELIQPATASNAHSYKLIPASVPACLPTLSDRAEILIDARSDKVGQHAGTDAGINL
ncbi:hypothetical protein HaLaN_21018 [Haematococcus lacustris]|uniref:Uncharacterized protein n=1 Tax=Haematococcus lacustris TaxID=44745 RepID=A0A699ZUW6_HAELA|nr:hypothetical protein HaLaN_21018 [Haematococcus lacustris]